MNRTLTKLLLVLLNLQENHPFSSRSIELVTSPEALCIEITTHSRFWAEMYTHPQVPDLENSPILAARL